MTMTEQSPFDVGLIAAHFPIDGTIQNIEPISVGHINDTFFVLTNGDEMPDYVIQRINHDIFKDVDKLMENIHRVTTHIARKLADNPATRSKKSLELVHSKNDRYYHRDDAGNYWRCYVYCQNGSASNMNHISPRMALEGGRALGKFQSLLSDLPGKALHHTIPDFHNLGKRFADFKKAIAADAFQRARQVAGEIELFESRHHEMMTIHRLGQEGKIPLRITHNDTKFNNILFDEKTNALCIIDLDTVMSGFVHYDFGDAIRTLANTAEEDDPDLDKVNFDFELFKQFAKGYLDEARAMLTETEIKYLAFSAKVMTYIIALRFMTDFLEGDIYYKTQHELHNLERCRNQLHLLQKMDDNFLEMEKAIRDL